MTLKELSFEISSGDVINKIYLVTKCKSSIIVTKNIKTDKIVKFGLGNTDGRYKKIMTVSRDGKTYYQNHGRGGYTHGVRSL